jgi:hypothetical protein
MKNVGIWVCFAVSAALWLGLFFGLNYPEIVVHDTYKSTHCTVVNSTMQMRYCCEKTCACTECINSNLPTCSSMLSAANNKSVYDCQSSINGSCPVVGGCCSGPKCCSQCCSTCKSCSGGKCSTYSCNCRCCSSVKSEFCQVTCPLCYSVEVVVEYMYPVSGSQNVSTSRNVSSIFDVSNETSWTDVNSTGTDFSNVTVAPTNATQLSIDYQQEGFIKIYQDFFKDDQKAKKFLSDYQQNSSKQCFYNPKNSAQVVFSTDYTWWKWLLTSIPSASLLLVLCGLTDAVILYFLRTEKVTFEVRTALWVGLILPVVVILPIRKFGHISHVADIVLLVIMLVFVSCGCGPLAVTCFPKRFNQFITSFLYFASVIVPISVFIPLIMISSIDQETKNVLEIVTIVSLALFTLMIYMWKSESIWEDFDESVQGEEDQTTKKLEFVEVQLAPVTVGTAIEPQSLTL